MPLESAHARSLWLVTAATLVVVTPATAQEGHTLPVTTVEASQNSNGSLTLPTAQQAQTEIQFTPGGVAIVRAEEYRTSTPAATIKDVLDYVPGVFVQPKWGEDSRLSIRGSGLSRNFHLRGVQLYMDGIPINTADGYGDFQEIDPTAYRYVEVFKGANALRYGATSLGGAINFVTASGRDAPLAAFGVDLGSFGFTRGQAQAAGVNGRWDGFITASSQRVDGFRDHSAGHALRGIGNIGYQITPDIETRFYLNGNSVRQEIPGSVTKFIALNSPQSAAASNIVNHQQRNIDSWRLANKTAARFGETTVEAGAFVVDRHLLHPIFQWLDYQYDDYGVFGRVVDDRGIGGVRNRFVAGVNVHNGQIDNRQFVNGPQAAKGALLSSSIDRSKNTVVYLEDSLFVLPHVAVIGGTQFIRATRSRRDRFLSNGDQSGATEFNLWNPRAGLLWDIDPTWQAFANVSRSAEIPSFGENSFANVALSSVRPQRATTYEIGTRGRRPNVTWDIALYRADITDELLCLTNPNTHGACNVVNANKSFHQGVEAGLGLSLFASIFVSQGNVDRLWLNIAYTFNDFHFRNQPLYGNNFIPGAPPHYVRAELLYRHPFGYFAGPNVEWVPRSYFVDSANTVRSQPYALLGAKVGYDDGRWFSAYLEGRNLTNVKYISSASIAERANAASPLFEPGTGLAVYGGVKFRFN